MWFISSRLFLKFPRDRIDGFILFCDIIILIMNNYSKLGGQTFEDTMEELKKSYALIV